MRGERFMDVASVSLPDVFLSKPELMELSNGLNLIVLRDDSAPVVSLQYWVGTGSIHEGEWLGTGISHFLEHLMFKGTERRGNSEMAQEIQSLGGHLNAYTTFDHTVYYVDLPSDQWKGAGEILGDAVFNSTLPAEEFDREQEVIRREFAMGEDNPDRRMSRLLFKTAFQKHPYRFPVIGHLSLFNQLKREDLVRYYKQRYVPQNVTLIVVGDVNPEEVKSWASEFLGKIPASILQEVVIATEPVQMLPREFRESFPTDLLRLSILFHTPGIEHEDTPALDLLSVMMGGTRGSKLHQLIVEQMGLAEDVSAYAYTPSGYGLWGVSARGQMENAAELEKVIREVIYHVDSKSFSDQDLDRSKRQLLLHHYRGLKSMSGKAGEIGGGWLLTRNPFFQSCYLERLRAVTLEEVVAVAQRYLRPSVENLISIVPEQKKENESISKAKLSVSKSAIKNSLLNGLPLIQVRNPHFPLMTYRAIFPGGLLAESSGKSGVSLLASQLLTKGTRRRTAAELIEKIESLGGILGADSNVNSSTLSLEILSSDWEEGLELFQEIINEPMLRPEELETERRRQMSSIQVDQDQPMSQARNMVREVLFSEHPYRNTPMGNIEDLSQIQGSDVESFWSQNLQSTGTIFALSSSIDPEQVKDRFQKAFAWKPKKAVLNDLIPFPLQQSFRVERTTPKQQAVLQFAFPTVSTSDPDQLVLEMLSEALSDLGSRLFVRIREKLGLAYFVGTSQFLAQKAGYFVFYVGTDPKKRTLVENEMLDEIRLIAEKGITIPEVERSRAKLLSHMKMMRQDPATIAYSAALHEYLGMGYDYHEKKAQRLSMISIEEINQVAQKYFSNPYYVTAIVSPE